MEQEGVASGRLVEPVGDDPILNGNVQLERFSDQTKENGFVLKRIENQKTSLNVDVWVWSGASVALLITVR